MTIERAYNFPFVVLDIETTGLSYTENEIIEIGAIRFNLDGSRDSFSAFIKPEGNVPYFIYNLTKIKEDDLRHADRAKVVLNNLTKFIKESDIIVCHNCDFDISFLNHHLRKNKLPTIDNQILDTLVVSRIFMPFLSSHKLSTIAEYFQIDFNNAHRAIYDAEVTGLILQKITDFVINHLKPEEINFLVTVVEFSNKPTARAFQQENSKYNFYRPEKESYLLTYLEGLRDYMVKYALLGREERENPFKFSHYNYIEYIPLTSPHSPLPTPNIQTIFSENGYFSRVFENYELRDGQIEMAHAVQEAFQKEEYLLVEAGTGVGKSLAYLVPALLFSQKTKGRIVVSTNTKNLQEQLLYKDIPLIIKAIDIEFSAVLIKGRENYLCLRKWQEIYEAFILKQANITFSPKEAFGIAYLYLWILNTKTGDVNENSAFGNSGYSHIWKKLSSDRHLCLGRKCRHYNRCFLMEVRSKAEKANLLIINHSLLFSDIQNEQSTLGEIDYLIFDEGHNLLHSAAGYLGFTLSFPDVQGFLNTIYCLRNSFQSGMMPTLKNACLKSAIPPAEKEILIKTVDDLLNYMDEKKDITDNVFKLAGEIAKDKGSYNKFRIKSSAPPLDILKPHLINLREYLEKIAVSLRQIQGSIMLYEAKQFANQDTMLDFLSKTIDRLNQFIRQFDELIEPNFDKNVFWLSRLEIQLESYPMGIFNYAPITVDDLLPDLLYRNIKSLIVTSATLSLRNSFKYFSKHLGFDRLVPGDPATTEEKEGCIIKTVHEKVVPSPFDYDKQTLILNTAYLPDNSDPYFFPQSKNLIQEILTNNKAGTLILFTSYKDLKMTYEGIEQTCFENDRLLLAQGISGNRNAILNQFIEDGNAVLLGTSSFWEGIDVQGQSLSLLILYKLPFQVPTEPIVEAYIEKLEKEGKQAFMHYSLPNALLKMRQGIGRLIRSKTDKGVILILDNRITKKDYGKYFREICPTVIQSMMNPTETADAVTKKLKM